MESRGWLVAIAGIVAVLGILGFAVSELPGEVAEGTTNNKGEQVVAIATAAITAVATLVAAFYGVAVAHAARKDAQGHAESMAKAAQAYAGALEPSKAEEIRNKL
jgi:hypothetical protein